MRNVTEPRRSARVLAFAVVATYVFLYGGAQTAVAQPTAWVGQVIATQKIESRRVDADVSFLWTATYDVLLRDDGTPDVLGAGVMRTKWSAAFRGAATFYSDSHACRVTEIRNDYGFGEGRGTFLSVYHTSGVNGAGYAISGGTLRDGDIFREFSVPGDKCQRVSGSRTLSGETLLIPIHGVIVPAPADDRWVLTGKFEAPRTTSLWCLDSPCVQHTVTVRLRRANCTGAPDEDGDGLNTCEEFDRRTDPSKWDTDGGGISDGDEVRSGTDPHNPEDDVPDPDGDGIPTRAPDNCPTIYNPDQANLDGDGLGNACDPDRDGDGLDNGSELVTGTYPDDPDSDDDTVPDGPDQCPLKPGSVPTGCSAGKLRATLRADYQTYWYGIPKKFLPFVKDTFLKVMMDGASSMTVTGDSTAISLVKQVCLDMTWNAYLRKGDTGGILWSDKRGYIYNQQGHELWTGDPDSPLRTKVKWCAPGLSVGYSTNAANTHGTLIGETLASSIEWLVHDLDGWVELTDGRWLRCEPRLTEMETAPKRVLNIEHLGKEKACDLDF